MADTAMGTTQLRPVLMAITDMLRTPALRMGITARTGSLAASSSALVRGSVAATTVAATTAEVMATMAGATATTAAVTTAVVEATTVTDTMAAVGLGFMDTAAPSAIHAASLAVARCTAAQSVAPTAAVWAVDSTVVAAMAVVDTGKHRLPD